MPALDFSGKVQLYHQLYDILLQDIVSGAYAVGDIIPSESELMRQYGVSRATARKAMEMLANNGLIVKKRGYGSEVISSYPNASLRHVSSCIKKSVDDRETPVKRLVDAGAMGAPADVAQALGVEEDTELYRLRRVRCSGDQPFYLDINYYVRSFIPGAAARDFSKESLRTYLTNECHVRWSRATQEIRAVVANEEMARLLHVEPGAPLLYIKRVSYDEGNVPRECTVTYYRTDFYHIEIELDA